VAVTVTVAQVRAVAVLVALAVEVVVAVVRAVARLVVVAVVRAVAGQNSKFNNQLKGGSGYSWDNGNHGSGDDGGC
jgi:hypothetical protein